MPFQDPRLARRWRPARRQTTPARRPPLLLDEAGWQTRLGAARSTGPGYALRGRSNAGQGTELKLQ
jgi:hypothetical protein